jgi:hypothetical protein
MFDEAGFVGRIAFEWQLPLDFSAWVRRINTPALYVDALAALMAGAPSEVRQAFAMTFDEGAQGRLTPVQFTIPGALLVGVRREDAA